MCATSAAMNVQTNKLFLVIQAALNLQRFELQHFLQLRHF